MILFALGAVLSAGVFFAVLICIKKKDKKGSTAEEQKEEINMGCMFDE